MLNEVTLLALVAILYATDLGATSLFGRVVGVHDGDTITVLDTSRAQHKIRLAGIDAPELKQAFLTRPAVVSTCLIACRAPHGSESLRGRMMEIGAILNRLNHFGTRSNRTLKRVAVAVFGN